MSWKAARAFVLGSSPAIAEAKWLVDVKYLFVCFLEIDLLKRPEDNHGAEDRNARYTMLMSPTVMPTGDSRPVTASGEHAKGPTVPRLGY